jgi:hypothetical protein
MASTSARTPRVVQLRREEPCKWTRFGQKDEAMTVDCLQVELFSFGIPGRDLVEQLNLEIREVPSAHIVA